MRYPLDIDRDAEEILNHFGAESQVLKAVEELCECAARLSKDLIENQLPSITTSPNEFTLSEIADATIMLRQIRLIYGPVCVDEAIDAKIERTLRRIKKE